MLTHSRSQVLWAVKLQDLVGPNHPPHQVVKNNVTFFRVGYHRGIVVLVLASESVSRRLSCS